jgi:hypothetical protein
MKTLRLPSARLAGAAAVACVSALVSAAALAHAASPGPVAASTSKCATSGLVVWLDTQGNGSAGSVAYMLEFTNLSGHTCTLAGYPGVSAVNLAGHQLGRAASRDHATSPNTVTLARGATAKAFLRVVDVFNYPNSACHRVTAAGLRVFPPNLTTSKVVPFPFSACSGSGPVYLSVRAAHH